MISGWTRRRHARARRPAGRPGPAGAAPPAPVGPAGIQACRGSGAAKRACRKTPAPHAAKRACRKTPAPHAAKRPPGAAGRPRGAGEARKDPKRGASVPAGDVRQGAPADRARKDPKRGASVPPTAPPPGCRGAVTNCVPGGACPTTRRRGRGRQHRPPGRTACRERHVRQPPWMWDGGGGGAPRQDPAAQPAGGGAPADARNPAGPSRCWPFRLSAREERGVPGQPDRPARGRGKNRGVRGMRDAPRPRGPGLRRVRHGGGARPDPPAARSMCVFRYPRHAGTS